MATHSFNEIAGWEIPIDSINQPSCLLIDGFTVPLNASLAALPSNGWDDSFNSISFIAAIENQGLGIFANANTFSLANATPPQGHFYNYLSSFTRFFGEGSKQTATQIIIDKASLPRLTPLANNTAESLLTAMLMRIFEHESTYLISKVTIVFQSKEFFVFNSNPYERVTFKIYLHYPYDGLSSSSATKQLTPNDY